jgi:hypothetical protein
MLNGSSDLTSMPSQQGENTKMGNINTSYSLRLGSGYE